MAVNADDITSAEHILSGEDYISRQSITKFADDMGLNAEFANYGQSASIRFTVDFDQVGDYLKTKEASLEKIKKTIEFTENNRIKKDCGLNKYYKGECYQCAGNLELIDSVVKCTTTRRNEKNFKITTRRAIKMSDCIGRSALPTSVKISEILNQCDIKYVSYGINRTNVDQDANSKLEPAVVTRRWKEFNANMYRLCENGSVPSLMTDDWSSEWINEGLERLGIRGRVISIGGECYSCDGTVIGDKCYDVIRMTTEVRPVPMTISYN